MSPRETPPLGVDVGGDVQERSRADGTTAYLARVRWTDPSTRRRKNSSRSFATHDEARAWIDSQREIARTGVDRGETLGAYVEAIGDRWARSIDNSSTYDPYSAGLRLRVLPTLGHLPVEMISAGLIDRAIDRWEDDYGRSTVKNTVAALVLVLDEAVRDGLLERNPAKDRARRKRHSLPSSLDAGTANPRDLALPDVETLNRIVHAVVAAGKHQCWGDTVMIMATTALRISEVAGLEVGDVDLQQRIVHVQRQRYPGRGGLTVKATKGRRRRTVPIIDPLVPTLERLCEGHPEHARLVSGPRGGVITSSSWRARSVWPASCVMGCATRHLHGWRMPAWSSTCSNAWQATKTQRSPRGICTRTEARSWLPASGSRAGGHFLVTRTNQRQVLAR